jgi:hypothetical protein
MCDFITNGRPEPCKDSVGGIKAVYFVNELEVSAYSSAPDEDVIDTAIGEALRYDVRGASTYTETVTSSRENGTTYFEQVLELQLPKLTKEDHKALKLLSYGHPQILIVDNNENVFVAGLEYGMDVTGGTVATGAAMGDASGYTLTFTGMEKIPANFISVAVEGNTAVENIVAAGFTFPI